MAKTNWKSIDDYLAAQPPASRAVLAQVRRAIRTALPDATEVISYQIPAYRADGGVVLFFAGWTAHYSVYPATAAVVSALAGQLDRYEITKGTIRFPLTGRVPVRLIARFAKLRAREVTERVRARRGRKKTGARKAIRPVTTPAPRPRAR